MCWLYLPRRSLVEQAQVALTRLRHIRYGDRAPHEGGPWLLRQRLRGCKIPELPLLHDDFRHPIVENPGAERGQASGFAASKHGVGDGFLHDRGSLSVGVCFLLPSARVTTHGELVTHGPQGCKEILRNLYR